MLKEIDMVISHSIYYLTGRLSRDRIDDEDLLINRMLSRGYKLTKGKSILDIFNIAENIHDNTLYLLIRLNKINIKVLIDLHQCSEGTFYYPLINIILSEYYKYTPLWIKTINLQIGNSGILLIHDNLNNKIPTINQFTLTNYIFKNYSKVSEKQDIEYKLNKSLITNLSKFREVNKNGK